MTNQEFQNSLLKYIDYQLADIEKLKTLNLSDFKSLSISCNQISQQSDQWYQSLADAGITKSTPVLYYFEIKGNAEKVFSVVSNLKKKYKRTSKNYKALPKVNKPNSGKISQILYVGKTNSNFISRFKYHLGLGSPKTYALQLLHWACGLNLELELHYSTLNLAKEDIRYLEQLESVMHYSLDPILGRAGH